MGHSQTLIRQLGPGDTAVLKQLLAVFADVFEQPEVYLEGGDHATLVHMSHAQFASLTATARHGSFSVHA